MKVYLSSTLKDLREHRAAVYRALRLLRLDVIAMEDGVAREDSPLTTSRDGLEGCAAYVGLFAFRYGTVPTDDNPDRLSITELEYHGAGALGIPRLLFIVPDDVSWNRLFDDRITGEGDGGEKIARLRAEVRAQKTTMDFVSPDQLATAVTGSVTRNVLNLNSAGRSQPSSRAATLPQARHIGHDLLLIHADADSDKVRPLVQRLNASGSWNVSTSNVGLLASSGNDLTYLERQAASARSAAVYLSGPAQAMLAEDLPRAARVLGLVRDRTGVLLGLTPGENPLLADVIEPWHLTEQVVLGTNPAAQVHASLLRHVRRPDWPEVGLPVVVVAMTAQEATDLLAAPPGPIAAVMTEYGGPDEVIARYGVNRNDWRPFRDHPDTMTGLLQATVSAVNSEPTRLQGRSIRLQQYPFQALMSDGLELYSIYQAIAFAGCLVLIDELSLFHPRLRDEFARSPFAEAPQAALVTLSPLDPTAAPPHALIRREVDGYLLRATQRYGVTFDPLTELGVPGRMRLDRWLHGNLPHALDALREAPRDPRKLADLGRELGVQPRTNMARLIAGEGLP